MKNHSAPERGSLSLEHLLFVAGAVALAAGLPTFFDALRGFLVGFSE